MLHKKGFPTPLKCAAQRAYSAEWRRIMSMEVIEEITIETLQGRWKNKFGQFFAVEAVWSSVEPAKMNILPWERV